MIETNVAVAAPGGVVSLAGHPAQQAARSNAPPVTAVMIYWKTRDQEAGEVYKRLPAFDLTCVARQCYSLVNKGY